jgi:hypothetical protein
MMINLLKNTAVKWRFILLFVLISYLLSLPATANLGDVSTCLINQRFAYGLDFFFRLLQGLGPFVAGLIVRKLDPEFIDSSLKGKFGPIGILLFVVSIGMVTVLGSSNARGLNPHYWGFITILVISIHAFFEEYGWRGYLEQALSPLPESVRVLLISLIWYFWHMSFLSSGNLWGELCFLLILIVSTFLLGRLLTSSKSILIVAAFHSIFNMVQWWNIDGNYKIISLIILITSWLFLINYYKRKKLAN